MCFLSAWLNAYVGAELILDRISGSPQHHRQREREIERTGEGEEKERGRKDEKYGTSVELLTYLCDACKPI